MKPITKAIKRTIKECQENITGLPNAMPVYAYLTLCAAQDVGIVAPRWRGQVDIIALENNYEYERARGSLENYWDSDLESFVRSLLLAGTLEPYETELLLEERSGLEILGNKLDSSRRSNLKDYDEELKAVLRKCKNNFRSNRSGPRLEEYLPDHWWWRYNLES